MHKGGDDGGIGEEAGRGETKAWEREEGPPGG